MDDYLSDDQLDKLLWGLTELPSFKLPLIQALLKINSFSNASELADEINHDPALVARILRIANSPFFGMSREVSSLQQAVVLLGLNRIRDLLIAVCFPQSFSSIPDIFDKQIFWRHSLLVADCTRNFAHRCNVPKDNAFVAGLLHDIGLIVMACLFPEQYGQIPNRSSFYNETNGNEFDLLAEEQNKFFGWDHSKIGARAALIWNFPVEIRESIECHAIENVTSIQSLPRMVYIANQLALKKSNELCQGYVDTLKTCSISLDDASSIKSKGTEFANQVIAML